MSPYYLIYQAQRARTAAEQRAAAVRSGELAGAWAHLVRSASMSVRSLHRAVRQRLSPQVPAGRLATPAGIPGCTCWKSASWS
jgi:hypothetical protein